jgi:nucleotide-binding universal stress UspA family protein
MKRIVVGLVDSPSSRSALQWAVDEAARSGALVEVVTCIQPVGWWWHDAALMWSSAPLRIEDFVAAAKAEQERVLTQEFGVRAAVLPIRGTVHVNAIPIGLVKAADGADLVVVGRTRRRLRFWRRSIGELCARAFNGPVVMVPATRPGSSGKGRHGATVQLTAPAGPRLVPLG